MAEKIYKFTFKKQKLNIWDANPRETYDIKYTGKEIGSMKENDNKKWTVSLMIPASEKALENNPNCPWTWGKIKNEFDTQEEARIYLNDNREDIVKNLYIEQD